MERYRLDKKIENQDLELNISLGHISEMIENINQSLNRRKELAHHINSTIYQDEVIEEPFDHNYMFDESEETITYMMEKN